jgi:hypothetical protein
MAKNLAWKDAIVQVMRAHGGAMHYGDIASAIVEQQLRTDVGATPASTVNANISSDINAAGEESFFIRVARGEYILRELSQQPSPTPHEESDTEPAEQTGIIQALGMFWRREYVAWSTTPQLLGQQQAGATTVNFTPQIGVYLLHDDREVVYVGRAIDQPLGKRLHQHTFDRLNGRWNRFSWFGLSSVTEDGTLVPPFAIMAQPAVLIAAFEALLIEGLEPRQNRKRGDDFRAVEYIQVKDPQIRQKQMSELVKRFEAMASNEGE